MLAAPMVAAQNASSFHVPAYACNVAKDSSLMRSISSVNVGTHATLDECSDDWFNGYEITR